MGNDAPEKYKKFTSGNVKGAYSWQQARFYWSKGNNYLFMLAFNVSTLSEEKMLEAAIKIVEQVDNNFKAKK